MKKGDYIRTPRFCTVKIEEIYNNQREAIEAGYIEPTYYTGEGYGIAGKSIDIYSMVFAAYCK